MGYGDTNYKFGQTTEPRCEFWKWKSTPVFLPGESHGWKNLVGYIPWGHTESDMTEATWHACTCLPTPVFLPGKSRGQRSLVGYNPWGCKHNNNKLLNNPNMSQLMKSGLLTPSDCVANIRFRFYSPYAIALLHKLFKVVIL